MGKIMRSPAMAAVPVTQRPGRTLLGLLLFVCAIRSAAAQGAIAVNGSARLVGGVLRLTPAARGQAGSACLSARQHVQSGFVTTFQFRITELGGGSDSTGANGGDGFAFVIQNSSLSALGLGGQAIGYGGIPNSLAVEFDTWLNGPEFFAVPDPNNNHVSVHTRGTAANSADESASLGAATRIPSLSDGRVHTASVTYAASSGGRSSLRVFIDGVAVLTVPVDLSRVLSLDAGRAFVGFTAATGDAFENHDILGWSFRPL